MPQEPYSLTRIFHPIGQGAFYSETHRIGDGPKTTVVYDCGSKTCKTKIKESIDEDLQDNRVTILFISHFHSDHCNGIEFLNPKYIVLPMLSEYEKVLLWIENTLNESELDMNYERTLRDRFPESRFIFVRKINDEDEGESEPLNLENFPGENIASGTPLRIGHTSSWDYIPVNPKLDPALIEDFKQRLAGKNIDYAKLCAFDYAYFNTCKEELQKIYREIRSPNEYSMAVYSGPGIPYHDFWERTLRYWNESCFSFTHIGRYPQRGDGPFCGCLYLGDMNLKEKGNAKSKILKKIYSLLPGTVFDCLSTIQVPHHGSFKNFNNALLSWYDKSRDSWNPWYAPMLYVISAGDPSPYHHPSPRVLEKLVHHRIVTQQPESRLVESFRFF